MRRRCALSVIVACAACAVPASAPPVESKASTPATSTTATALPAGEPLSIVGPTIVEGSWAGLRVRLGKAPFWEINSHLLKRKPGAAFTAYEPAGGNLRMRARCLDERGVPVLQGTSFESLDALFAAKLRPDDGASVFNSMIKLPLDRVCEVGASIAVRKPNQLTEQFFCWQRPGAEPPRQGRCSQFSATPSVGLLGAELTKVELVALGPYGVLMKQEPKPEARIDARLTLGTSIADPIETRAHVRCDGTQAKKRVSWQGQGAFSQVAGWHEPGDVLERSGSIALVGPEEGSADTCFVSFESAIVKHDRNPGARKELLFSGKACFGRVISTPQRATPKPGSEAALNDFVAGSPVFGGPHPLVKDGMGCP